MKLYVEGGGNPGDAKRHDLAIQCRKGFSKFLEKAGFENRMPGIVACGARGLTFSDFRKGLKSPESTNILLVDSESPIVDDSPWEHVKHREGDNWDKPAKASEDDLHFMVQTMEAWFHADREALAKYYGDGFQDSALKKTPDMEQISRGDLEKGLTIAPRNCKKSSYRKGSHSFEILAAIDPAKVRKASTWADRFLQHLDRLL